MAALCPQINQPVDRCAFYETIDNKSTCPSNACKNCWWEDARLPKEDDYEDDEFEDGC